MRPKSRADASPTLVTVIKVLLPTQGQNTSICFDVEAQTNRIPRNPVLTLLYDPATGISITGEMLQGQHLHTIGVRHKDGCYMKANTTAIVVTQEEIESVFSWADLGMSHRCDGITLNLHDEVLLVEMGKVHLRILRHKDGQSNFLWTAISLQAPIPGAKGLLGNSPISYVLKETTSTISAKLEILGKEVMGRRVSAVDYSIHSKPTVDCWLVPFSSVVPGSLQDVLSS
ncbi:hypothetical protein JZ751_014515 [Albula glossodonta]|uniref:Uncharacterized protein n=1 Tax=Albula glossodonta TaxID=121402 RepID=A0A8T2N7D8_9TELE|nr:hypothetical protein JZ751_014515 [Albula glossodonta]